MPASLAGPTTDPWNNFGFVYGRTGATRGTTTSSGILTISTGFARQVVFVEATDEATHTRVAQTGGGPAQTTSTFFLFNMATIDPTAPTIARLRVIRWKASSDMNASFTLGSTLTGVTARWIAFGY